MFEENENIYPVKPELLVGSSNKNRIAFFILVAIALAVLTGYSADVYIVLLELLIVLLIHELGHFLMMRFYKTKSQGMFIMSFLGKITKDLRFSNSLKEQTIINLMGPLPGILIGCSIFLLISNSEPNIYLIEIALLLLGINILNLVPIDPFDGGRIIGSFFFNKNDQMKMIFTLASSLIIIIIGVVSSFIPLIVFGFLMGLKVRSYQKSNDLHELLNETNINYKKEYNDLTDREYWKIRSVFLRKNPKLKEIIPSGYILWENERLLMEQVRQLLRTDIKSDLSISSKLLVLLLIVLLIAGPIYLIFSNYDLIDWYMQNSNV